MRARQARSSLRARPRRRLRLRPGRFLVAVIVINLLIVFGSQQIGFYRAERRVSELRNKISVERERTALLQAELAYRDTDEFVEKVARRELGLVYPGEIPVVSGVRP